MQPGERHRLRGGYVEVVAVHMDRVGLRTLDGGSLPVGLLLRWLDFTWRVAATLPEEGSFVLEAFGRTAVESEKLAHYDTRGAI